MRSALSALLRFSFLIVLLTTCFIATQVFGQTQLDSGPDFAADVRPVLSDKCMKCHGPDKAQRATDLRLDEEASVHSIAIDTKDLAKSALIQRLDTTDPSEVMPPPDSKMQLTTQERELLRQWVLSGAKFSKHWAFEPLKEIAVPKLPENSAWKGSTNPIDAIVGHRLLELGITPSPEAEPTTLIRRVYLDLIGLPPNEKELDQYLQESSVNRYEQVIDRLLANPHFGERWAVDWLDAARYADTHGYQNDRYRATWPWRDWVIEAFNNNLPFDKFITWQLAGDLLPNASREQIVATAFNRLHRQTNEGGSIEEEFRNEYVADRVNTFGAAFLGLTMECARCHDHKYDPIGQKEYYQLAAFFNNIDESGLYSHFTDAVPTPALQLNTPEQLSKIELLNKQIADKQTQRSQIVTGAAADGASTSIQDWYAFANQVRDRLKQTQIAHYSFESLAGKKSVNSIKQDSFAKTHEAPQLIEGKVGQGVLLSGENSITLNEGGAWERNQPFTISMWIKSPKSFERCVLLHRSRAWTDSASRGYELLIENGRLSAALIHFWPGNAMRIVALQPLTLDQWQQVTWTYDGCSLAAGMKLWVNGQAIETEVVRDCLTQAIKGDEAKDVTIGQRFRDVGFKGGAIDELRIFESQLSDVECRFLYLQDSTPNAVANALSKCSAEELKQFTLFGDAQIKQIDIELFELRGKLAATSDPIPEIMVMKELPGKRSTFILRRGQYDAPLDRVDRGILANIMPLDKKGSELSRLELAKWLTDPKHPLTSRVAVNRIWQSLFGRGLVATTEDFGLQGAAPTNPQLMDWLAQNYIQSGWDTKQLIKTIMMSRVYRQSSNLSPSLLQSDSENQWLSRGPANRLSAELLRDAALSASGLLVEQIGGPPVKPYQPEGLWEEKSGEAYKRDSGDGSHRRSLYTFWKRTSPPPMMMTFDASNREVCVVRRQSTMTPLQTLVVLNDPQFVEAARALAERAMIDFSELDLRLSFMFRRLTARVPEQSELNILQKMYRQQFEYFAAATEEANKFLSIGDHKPDPARNVIELASLAAVAEGLMSYDEFVMKR